MLQKIAKAFGYDPQKKEILDLSEIAAEINDLEPKFEKYSDQELSNQTSFFRQRLADGETLDELMVEAFAVVREVSKRTLGLRHYDVQMIGGIAMHRGTIAEMRTGEGKTLVATLPIYLNALTGRGVHLITVNDYLARRDARWMAPIYRFLGLSVGVLQMANRTENGRKAFLIDLEKTSSFEDQDQLVMVDRKEAYKADVTYGTNSEFGFDFLRDNLANRLENRVQRGHYFAIIDEVDNVLIDEARTPLIISGPASDDTEWYNKMAQIVRQLNPEDYEISEKDRYVALTEIGEAHVEELLQMPLRDPERPEDINPEQAKILGFLEQALKAQFLFKRNKDYLVQGGKVVIVDEFTGRLMPGRRWSEGLHQSVEAKEGVKVEPENVTYATITIQNYFRMYEKLSGMTGTALTEAEEFNKIYKLEVLPIPMNLEYQAMGKNATMTMVQDKDEYGYKYTYYAYRDDDQKSPVFYKRKDYPDIVYRTEEAKLRAIVKEAIRFKVIGRPQLLGTTSVEHSEILSTRLSTEMVRRLLQVLLIREFWMEKNGRDIIEQAIPELAFLNEPLQTLNSAQMRSFSRSIGLNSISLTDEENLQRLLRILDLEPEHQERLIGVINAGVQHEVLNARKHDEEALIIQKAGAFGAVTIATNMAGRGVDIKLGGEISEEIYADIARVLKRNQTDPYEMKDEEKRQVLLKLSPEQYGIYEDSVKEFLQAMDDMEKVRELGGLHVIGSERHDARRIDNQLRGRSSRQGDPGSSRFYLSLEDELMRLFGGQQVEGLMRRLKVDESMPIESGIVGRLVEQSQERVEGANFDVRKHLLEYDDVLNMQRQRIYEQRDRIFTKENLIEDVMEMLETEVNRRVEPAMIDEEGPWKLVAFVSDTQPPVDYEGVFYPSFSLRLLMEQIKKHAEKFPLDKDSAASELLWVAEESLKAEYEHVMSAAKDFLVRVEESMETQKQERLDTLDSFMDGLQDRLEEENPRGADLLTELSNMVRTPLRLSGSEMSQFLQMDEEIEDKIREQIEDFLVSINSLRVIGTFAIRVDGFNLSQNDVQGTPWAEQVDLVLDAIEEAYQNREKVLLGENGSLAIELHNYFKQIGNQELTEVDLYRAMILMVQGSKIGFDKKTHRQVRRRYMRLNYVYWISNRLLKMEIPDVKEFVLSHMQGAIDVMKKVWGIHEFRRLSQSEGNLSQIDKKRQEILKNEFGTEKFEEIQYLQLTEISEEEQEKIQIILGERFQNEIYRELLLSIISQAWVEYLTKVEALRVSIGLEAYAQRDPLVMYKGQASEMFKELLSDIRSGLISRMFTFRPSQQAGATIERAGLSSPKAVLVENSTPAEQPKSKKKRRKRH
jgi:preprotein translocase subunit SecA